MNIVLTEEEYRNMVSRKKLKQVTDAFLQSVQDAVSPGFGRMQVKAAAALAA